jgi:hypothetical protein
MSANHTALEPEHPHGDAFLDAVLGVEYIVRHLGEVIDDAIEDARADDSPAGERSDYLLDALLGLVSLRKTVVLIVAAAASDLADVAQSADAAWSRELLR